MLLHDVMAIVDASHVAKAACPRSTLLWKRKRAIYLCIVTCKLPSCQRTQSMLPCGASKFRWLLSFWAIQSDTEPYHVRYFIRMQHYKQMALVNIITSSYCCSASSVSCTHCRRASWTPSHPYSSQETQFYFSRTSSSAVYHTPFLRWLDVTRCLEHRSYAIHLLILPQAISFSKLNKTLWDTLIW